MNKTIQDPPERVTGDVVLQEIWRAKDALAAEYGYDLDKFFAAMSEGEKLSGHPIVNFQRKPQESATRQVR